jgi:predicted MFS family arabinose efflux permease
VLSAIVFSVAMIVGPGLGAWIADQYGVSTLFAVATVASLAAVPLTWLVTRTTKAPRLQDASAC